MDFLSKLERKIGKYAIPNLTLYLIVGYAIGYVLQYVGGVFLSYLTLNPYKIFQGQVWRLFTWVIIPPDSFDFFTLIMLYFYYSIGQSLESVWGTFRYNVFLFSGMIFTVVAAILMGAYYILVQPDSMYEFAKTYMGFTDIFVNSNGPAIMGAWFELISSMFSTYYICMSLFLAYAITFPEMQVLLMMILPIKVKVLGVIYAIVLGLEIFSVIGTPFFLPRTVAVLSTLCNVIIFFLMTRSGFKTPKQAMRQRAYKREVKKVTSITKHKCAICGRTEVDSPDLAFRFCSKCDGNYEYCEEHLYTHKHVTREEV